MSFDILIVGSGITGTALACALSEQSCPLRIALIDATPAPKPLTANHDWALRVSAITPASRQILDTLRVWQNLPQERLSPYTHMTVWEHRGLDSSVGSLAEKGEIQFDAMDLGLDALGWIVENEQLLQALLERARNHDNITLLRPLSLHSIHLEEDVVTLKFNGHPDIDGKLLVGADGARSQVRNLANITTKQRDYHSRAIVATVQTEKSHRKTAWQRFLPTGPLAFLPLTDPHQVSIVWSLSDSEAERHLHATEEDFNQALMTASESRLGTVRLISDRACFPLRYQHAEHYIRHRLALVGDAAHTIHPLAGQGLNMGLMDVHTLATQILKNRENNKHYWSKHRLRAYEIQRRSENSLMLELCDTLHHLFQKEYGPLGDLRRLGINLCNSFSPLKRQMIRYATHIDSPFQSTNNQA